MNKEDTYTNLMTHLGEVGTGYPKSDDFLEVLRKIFSPEEAEVALGLPTRLPPLAVEDVETIAGRLGKPVHEVESVLEQLAKRALVYSKKTDEGKMGYAFIQMGYGIPQIFYWKGWTCFKNKFQT